MIVTFWVSTGTRPVGGVKAIFEFANGLSRLGHTVNLVHFSLADHAIESAADIDWFPIEADVRQLVIRAGDGQSVPDGDFIFPYHEIFPEELGRPLNLVQGWQMMPREMEQMIYVAPCPKVCVARWLLRVGRELGVPEEQLVYVPCGIDHTTFALAEPVEQRPMQVAMLYHEHRQKGTEFGLEVLERVKERVPDLTVVLFGATEPPEHVPEWMTTVRDPAKAGLARIYNRTRVFVCSSIVEGFGLTSVEAMACGCALVTSDNGGSEDFAFHDDTALVSPPNDVETMTEHVVALLRDDTRRVRIARRGQEFVERFDWDASCRTLEAFLIEYGADPDRYRTPVGGPPPTG